MIRKNTFLLAALVLLVTVCMFTGCKQELDASIIGTWKSTYDETFVITDYSFSTPGDYGYAGIIKKIRDDGTDAGYITIQYTTHYDASHVNLYYVIHYKNLTSSTVDIAGAWLVDAGKTTQELAESTYTVAAGAFDLYSVCTRQ